MKSFKLLSVLICLFLSASLAWGGTPSYVLDATSSDNAGSNNGYATSCDVTVEGITWNVTGNSTLSPWRIGGKSLIGVDRAVYSKTAYANAVDSIKLEIGAASSVTINSIKLIHSTNADFSSSTTINASGTSASTTYTFKPEGGFAANSYYKFVFNVTIGGSNKFIEFKTVSIYDHPTGPSVSVTGVSLNKTSTSIVEGETETLTATIAPSNATNKAVTWSSSNESVAIVSNGKVTAVSAGSADITVSTTDGSKTATCAVTVTDFVPAAGSYDIVPNNAFWGISQNGSVSVSKNTAFGPKTKYGISVSMNSKSSTSSYINADHSRAYNGYTVTLAAPEGFVLTSIVFTGSTWVAPTANVGTVDSKTWTGNAKEVTFTFSGTSYMSKIAVTYAATTKSAVTLATCENGSVDASATTDVAEGTEVTLSNTPATGYKLTAYDVYKTGESATKVTVTNGKFTMPAYGVTVSATFELAKVFSGTSLTLSGTYPTEFWKGDTFSNEGLVATAHFNTGDEIVTPTFSTPNMTTIGKQTITVTFTEGAASQTATYEITVKTIANTEATAYTVAEAFALIDAGKDLSSTVYVKGKISQVVTAWSDQYNNITYNISVDGETTSDQLQLFRCVTKDVPVQSDVVAKGTLLKFNGTYELAAGNSIVSHVAPAVVKTTATITLSTYKSSLAADEADDVLTVTYNGDGTIGATSSNEAVATVSIEGTTVTIHPVATGTATITVSAPATDTYTNATKSYTLTVTAALTAAELPFNFDGGKADVDSHVSMREKGLNTTDYSASPKLKFDSQGDEVVVRIADAAKKVTYTIKGNSYTAGQFDVLQSADNKTYTTLKSHTTISADGEAITIDQPASETRYIKFVYTTKNAGNVALGNIKIIAAGAKEDPAFSVENMSMLLEEVASPTINRGGSTGAISYTFTPGNFTESAGVFTALSVGGPVTVTATMAGDANYNEAQTTFTITVVDPATFGDAVSIVFPYDGKYYAMKSDLSVVEVIYANDKLYGIAPADKKDLTWYKKVDGETATFRTASGKYLAGSSKTNLNVVAESYSWNIDGDSYSVTISSSKRSFFMNDSYEVKNYAVSNAGNSGFSDLAVLATGFGELTTIPSTVAVGSFGTMCQAKEVLAIDGAIVYAVEKKNPIGIDLVEAEFPLTAGRPYFYQATKATVGAVYGAAEAASAQNDEANGLHGNISTAATMVGAIPVDCYVVQNDNLRRVPSVMDLPANRAYLNYEEVLDKSAGASPTRRRVTMGGVSTDTPTSVDALSQEDGATKFFENGILYIIRDGKVYNAQGQLIK